LRINEKTTIPVWSVFTAIPFVVGAILWISAVAYDVAQAKSSVNKLEQSQEKNSDILLEIRERIIRIEEKISKERK